MEKATDIERVARNNEALEKIKSRIESEKEVKKAKKEKAMDKYIQQRILLLTQQIEENYKVIIDDLDHSDDKVQSKSKKENQLKLSLINERNKTNIFNIMKQAYVDIWSSYKKIRKLKLKEYMDGMHIKYNENEKPIFSTLINNSSYNRYQEYKTHLRNAFSMKLQSELDIIFNKHSKSLIKLAHKKYYNEHYQRLKFKLPTSLGGVKYSIQTRKARLNKIYKVPGPGKYEIIPPTNQCSPNYSFSKLERSSTELKYINKSLCYEISPSKPTEIR